MAVKKRGLPASAAPTSIAYALEQLYVDQDHDFVVACIPAVLAWVDPGGYQQPFVFSCEHASMATAAVAPVILAVSWSMPALQAKNADVANIANRMRTGRTPQREHVPELAAYGLALVAISALMPGRRVVGYMCGTAPDILLDSTPGSLRGVEVAGRTGGGFSALRAVRDGTAAKKARRPTGGKPARKASAGLPGKAAQLLARTDIVEVHLSLWCRGPRVAILQSVKP